MEHSNRRMKDICRVGAYMSVEAAFIVPTAFFIMVFIIYGAFWVYGRCILSQDTYLVAMRAVNFYDYQGYGSCSDYVRDKADTQFGSKYFGNEKPRVSSEDQGKKVLVTTKTSAFHNGVSGYFKKLSGKWESEAKAVAKERDFSRKLRKFKRMKDVAKKVIE